MREEHGERFIRTRQRETSKMMTHLKLENLKKFQNPFVSKKDMKKELKGISLTAFSAVCIIVFCVTMFTGDTITSFVTGVYYGKKWERENTRELQMLYTEAIKQLVKSDLEKKVNEIKGVNK